MPCKIGDRFSVACLGGFAAWPRSKRNPMTRTLILLASLSILQAQDNIQVTPDIV
jgi:hypothetical protein